VTTEPPLNLENGFTVSAYFPPGSDPHWVSDFLNRVADDAHSMPSDTLDAFVVGHAADVLGVDCQACHDSRCPTCGGCSCIATYCGATLIHENDPEEPE
jgi:hypothetical protein